MSAEFIAGALLMIFVGWVAFKVITDKKTTFGKNPGGTRPGSKVN